MTTRISFPVGLNTQWCGADSQTIPDPYLKNWLLDTGSLTERLQSHCRQFDLQLLGQDEVEVSEQEAWHLTKGDAKQNNRWQVREVILKGEGVPWVFARSLIPKSLCEDDLADLGTKPLGQIIFNDHRFVREPFEISHLQNPTALLQHIQLGSAQQLWGRRSVFSYRHFRMSVAEVFLPSSPAYKQIPNLIHDID